MLPSIKNILKKGLLTGAFFFFAYSLPAQDKGDFRLGFNTYINTYSYKTYTVFGLDGEYFLSENFALNYRFGMGRSPDGSMAFHFPISWLGIAFAADAEALVLLSMIPEGVSVHLYPNEKLEISPFVNLLGSELLMGDEQNEFNILAGTGVKAYFKPNDVISLSGSYGISTNYRKTIFFNAGFSVGFIF